MRILEVEELINMGCAIKAAIKQTSLSPCEHSQRGAAAFRLIAEGDRMHCRIAGVGNNHPVFPRECQPAFCLNVCRDFTIHAEKDAIQDAIAGGHDLNGVSLLHLKRKDSDIAYSDDLSCLKCSTDMMDLYDSGVRMNEMVLYQSPGIWVAFRVPEYHEMTLRYINTGTCPPSRQQLVDQFLGRI